MMEKLICILFLILLASGELIFATKEDFEEDQDFLE